MASQAGGPGPPQVVSRASGEHDWVGGGAVSAGEGQEKPAKGTEAEGFLHSAPSAPTLGPSLPSGLWVEGRMGEAPLCAAHPLQKATV